MCVGLLRWLDRRNVERGERKEKSASSHASLTYLGLVRTRPEPALATFDNQMYRRKEDETKLFVVSTGALESHKVVWVWD